jgi:hypothetical protein
VKLAFRQGDAERSVLLVQPAAALRERHDRPTSSELRIQLGQRERDGVAVGRLGRNHEGRRRTAHRSGDEQERQNGRG